MALSGGVTERFSGGHGGADDSLRRAGFMTVARLSADESYFRALLSTNASRTPALLNWVATTVFASLT